MFDSLNQFLADKGLKIDEAKAATRRGIIDYLRQARDDNKAFLAIPSPTAAERNAQIIKLTRQSIRIMRLLMNDLTGEE